MQTSSQPKLLPVPFANGGSKQDIPNDSQIGITAGRASYIDGFPPLTRTPLAAGGVPPFGTDFNGILNDITAAIRWAQAGASYPFDSSFNSSVAGYPKGARILNSTYDGFWLNTVDGNLNNPENTTSTLTGWVPSGFYGVTSISGLSGSSVTLTTLQAGRDRIVFTGALTANISVSVPAWIKRWDVSNNCTGNFAITFKTVSGTGISVAAGTSALLQGDGTNIIQAASPGSLLNIQTFTSSGTYTPTLGAKKIRVRVWGGGGGGGGVSSSATVGAAGGAGGGYTESLITLSTITTPVSVVVGAGGSSGSSTGGTGGAGGSSSFGSLLTASGGGGGGGATGSTGGATPTVVGTGTGGSIFNILAQGGQAPVSVAGGSGGASFSSFGGTGHYSSGSGAGGFPGGGGGGANGVTTAVTGGSGGAGYVIIEEFA